MTTMQMYIPCKHNILPTTEEMAPLITTVLMDRKNCNIKVFQMAVSGDLSVDYNAKPTMLAGRATYLNVVKQELGLEIVMPVTM
tara:strand:- start:284 stop:535 length:252 start_codon:yes stop_codon:yes gene_type:complete